MGACDEKCNSYVYLCAQNVCNASNHSHKVKHIPGLFQVVLKERERRKVDVIVNL